MGITNTISRAELAAIAAAVIHGCSHIATDSLTSLHQIKKELSHPNLHRHHIQKEMSFNPLLKPTPLLKSQPPPTPTLQTPPSKHTAASEGNLFYNTTGLQKKKQKTKHKPIIIPIQQTWPILLPQSFGTYQTTVTPFKHTCIFSINWEMPKLERTTMRTTRPS